MRLVQHHFLKLWQELDPEGSKHPGLINLMRQHRERMKPESKEKLERYLDGFHTVMEMISRRAFGFKNFNNYRRKRVIALCGWDGLWNRISTVNQYDLPPLMV
ncbi:MAG: hypothetical protein COV44_10965 [Deltaproteobacteria bacterium CG11_big_fil_rev_8_21_14_0_20_45_16]|nr:MAG: hypothetical protein COV44_10965 [Deltaproteobacteria bacterium CG11_big_fil_rev_8_21_14_0_20_45_16]